MIFFRKGGYQNHTNMVNNKTVGYSKLVSMADCTDSDWRWTVPADIYCNIRKRPVEQRADGQQQVGDDTEPFEVIDMLGIGNKFEDDSDDDGMCRKS